MLILFTQLYHKRISEMDYSELQEVFNYGYFVCSQVERSTIRPSAHTTCLCMRCGFENKLYSFPSTTLTVWVL
jgi:hypothetical protein